VWQEKTAKSIVGDPARKAKLVCRCKVAYARKIDGVSGATQVGAKFEFSRALTNGKVMCWGGGGWSGAVGPNFDEDNAHIPVEVPLPVKATTLLL